MTSISLEVPIVGQKNTTEEPKVGNSITTIQSFINGKNLDGTTNIKAEGVEEANLSAAVVTKLNQKSAGLEFKKQTISATGESGILYLMETNATTLTLTATATAGKQVGIICKNGILAVTLKAGVGAKIFGDAVNGAASVVLGENQHLIVEADGTNWWILSGVAGGIVQTEQKSPPAFLSWGLIGSTGTILAGSGDFTVVHSGTGGYEITWTKAKTSANYAVVVTVNSGSRTNITATANVIETTKFGVLTNENTVAADGNFSFMAAAAS